MAKNSKTIALSLPLATGLGSKLKVNTKINFDSVRTVHRLFHTGTNATFT